MDSTLKEKFPIFAEDLMKYFVDSGGFFRITSVQQQELTLGLRSRVAAVAEDARRLVDVATGRFGPAAAVGGALAVVVFLSEVEVVLEGVGRLAGAVPPAAALLGRVLAAAVGLVAPAAGCDAGPRHTGAVEGKIRRESKGKEKNKEMITAGQVKQHKQHYDHKSYKVKINK